MTAKPILFLTKRFYTNKDLINDRFGRNYFLPTGLAKLGHRVRVIIWDYRSSQSSVQTMDSVQFIIIGCRGFSAFSFLFKTLYHIILFKPKVVMGSGDSYFGFFAWFFARVVNAKCFFDVYDFYPTFVSNRLPAMKWLFYQALRRVDKVYCASKPLEELIKNYNTQVFFVPNAIDHNCFKEIDKLESREYLGFDKHAQFIGYFGSLSYDWGITDLIEAFELLRKENKNIFLLLAGSRLNDININKTGIYYLGTLSQDKVAIHLSVCDVLVMSYRETEQIKYGNACKTMEYIASMRPIVATQVDCVIKNYDFEPDFYQALCLPNNPLDMARAIKWQLNNQYLLPKNLAITWEELAKKLASELAG